MIIKGKLSYKDYRKYFLFYARTRYTINFMLFFISFTLINMSISVEKNIFKHVSVSYDIILAFIVALFLSLAMLFIFLLRVKAMYRKNDRIKIENEYRVGDDGITINSERGQYLLKWTDLTKAFTFQNVLLIYSEGNQATILPYSFFQNENDLKEFKEILKKRIKKTKLK